MILGLLLAPTAAFSAAGEKPLPQVEEVLNRVIDNLDHDIANEQLFKETYRYTRSKKREFKNTEGEIKKLETKMRTNDPMRVLSKKVSQTTVPKPAPPTNTDDEEPVSETNTKVRGKQFEKSDFPIGPELLERFEFKMIGREPINGRPALILDFAPADRKLPEKSIKDKFINKAAGRVWIDESDFVLVRAEVFLSRPVNVFGGLVGAVKKFSLQFTRHRTPEGLWFSRTTTWHLEGREVLIRRVVDYHEEITDVERVVAH
jgi:hypothetical protein